MHDSVTERVTEQRSTEHWLTPAEIAERLKLTEARVDEVLVRNEIEHVLVAGERRVSRAALDRYLERVAQRAAPARPRARIGVWMTVGGLSGLLLVAGLLNAAAPSATSSVIPYHGYLEEDGLPVEERKYFTFCLTRSEADTNCVWTENHVLDVAGGHFSANLGSVNSLDSLMAGAGDLFLGVTVDSVNASNLPVGTPVTLNGKQLLGSAPFARRGAPGENFVVDGTLTSSSLSVDNSVSIAQSLTVANQMSARQLNLSGRIIFNNVQRFCMFASTCPADWTDNGIAGFLVDTSTGSCPFTLGGVYSGSQRWCHPHVCCN